MNFVQGLESCVHYLAHTEIKQGFLGSLHDTVKNSRGLKQGVTADLHAHPYISKPLDVKRTTDIMFDHQIDILASTVHGKMSKHEYRFEKVKILTKLLEQMTRGRYLYHDRGLAFQVSHELKYATVIGAYEICITHPLIRGTLDMVCLMPDPGYEALLRENIDWETALNIAQRYNGITILTHPFTISDPHGPITFRPADEREKSEIISLAKHFDAVDSVSQNALWMMNLDDEVKRAFSAIKIPVLSNSDAHGVMNYARKEIGRSRNYFPHLIWDDGEELRLQLRKAIKNREFHTKTNYSPLGQFAAGVAFSSWFMS
jgi:hypothetical protein